MCVWEDVRRPSGRPAGWARRFGDADSGERRGGRGRGRGRESDGKPGASDSDAAGCGWDAVASPVGRAGGAGWRRE